MKRFSNHIIHGDSDIRNALEALNKISNAPGTVPLSIFIIDENNRLQGSVTDGDIRRGLLSGETLDDEVNQIMNTDYHFLEDRQYSLNKIKQFRKNDIDLVPILDQHKVIEDILDLTKKESLLPLDAVVMAGGVGKRLRPLTENTPKPLLKVGDKPIIDHIIDRIDKFGIPNVVTLSVRYLSEQLIDHFNNTNGRWDLTINFICEDKPMGTIGSLSLMNDFRNDTILLSNGDLLSTINYESFYEFFMETDADVAVASVPYDVKVPYGIFNTNGTDILSIEEKPEYSYFSNAGIYLLKRKVLSHLPNDDYLDITDFLKLLIEKNLRVTYYPLLGYWQDVGKPEDYRKVQKDIKLIDIEK